MDFTENELDIIFSKDEKALIKDEFQRLNNLTYLDHTGSALYPQSYIKEVVKDLSENVYSNPHSNSTTSKFTLDAVDQVRYRILKHFNTNFEEYSVLFTSGATAALKLVAESFSWSVDNNKNDEWLPAENSNQNDKGEFVYLQESHTSVLGMREIVERKGVRVNTLSNSEAMNVFAKENSVNSLVSKQNSLFVYPAQCNFSGFKYPLSWIKMTQAGKLDQLFCSQKSNWYCLLDAATYVSTNVLDLSKYKPDFVVMSFYKIFGYPTGLGALLVRNSSAFLLEKHYYGGGTVLIALTTQNSFVPRPVLHERFEDGSIDFLSILSLKHGFDNFYKLVGSMDKVSRYTFLLAKYTFYHLVSLHHSNGLAAVKIYSDSLYEDFKKQGAVVNFNLLRSDGDYIGFVEVLNLANLHGIQLRTGCFCNLGACQRHLNLSSEIVKFQYQSGHVCGDDNDLIDGTPTGSIRVSFGYYSCKEDCDKLISLIENCFVQKPVIRSFPQSITRDMNNDLLCHRKDKQKQFKMNDPLCKSKFDVLMNDVDQRECDSESKECSEAKLSNIFIYPVKSCGHFSASSWDLDSRGLKYDRLWMVVNASGVALTQKKETKLCLIRPLIQLDSEELILEAKGFPECRVNLNNEGSRSTVSRCESKVCGDHVNGIDCGDEVASWLCQVLNRDGVRLMKQLPLDPRSKADYALSLANQAQYLLINKSSVAWLADQIKSSEFKKSSLVDRFRSNFVVTDVDDPFVEQTWTSLQIGSAHFTVKGPCGRCQMICINQDTGEVSKEPLTSLAASMKGKLKFGIYLTCLNHTVTVSVGDTVIFR